MGQKATSVTRLAATALLVGVAVLGCANHNGTRAGQPAVPAPVAQPSQVVGPTPTPVDSAAPNPANAPGATAAPAAASDSVDSQISDLEKQLNAIDGSLSGGDAVPSSGE
jgi:negative regulator of sigma E activity